MTVFLHVYMDISQEKAIWSRYHLNLPSQINELKITHNPELTKEIIFQKINSAQTSFKYVAAWLDLHTTEALDELRHL